jgi:hypothetical protein
MQEAEISRILPSGHLGINLQDPISSVKRKEMKKKKDSK